MTDETKIVILHNIVSPYKTLLFKELSAISNGIEVLYMAHTENNRQWHIDAKELNFPHRFIFDGSLDNINSLKLAIKTWKELNIYNPDILILGGYIYSACWAGFMWAKLNKKKIILWSATNQDDHDREFVKEKIKGLFIKRCDAANVYGRKSRDYLIRLGMNKNAIFIKGNVTDNNFYCINTNEFRIKKKSLSKQYGVANHNFLYIGRFSKEKNILHLLKTYKRLEVKNDWGLILIGDGPQSEEITNYIERNNIKNVFSPGFQQKEDIPKFLAVSDVFILPSTSEPWGLVVNEAMAAGLPILVSKRCGCYPDLIKESINGFSFDPFDDTELFGLMKDITDGKHNLLSMGKASLEIIKDYTLEKAAKVISETIEFVLNNK
jgi:glycosyltransferase involved in cell wall biosynthesis